MDNNNIKAILFDSGRVLNHPRTGHWFIPPNFFIYVDRALFESLDRNKIDDAFKMGGTYLEGNPFILTEEDEFKHFIEFYRIFSKQLPELSLREEEIIKIAKDTVFNDEKFFFHEDVFEIIPKFKEKYKLGVVSDTWPSLDRVFNNMGLRKYFSTFVMSSVLGISKPHEKMYTTALDELGLKPQEALFIDDNLINVEGAQKLGLKAIVMLREDVEDMTKYDGHIVIKDTWDLNKLLK